MHPVVVLFDDASKRNCVRLPYVCARTRKFGENQKNSNSGGESSVMKSVRCTASVRIVLVRGAGESRVEAAEEMCLAAHTGSCSLA